MMRKELKLGILAIVVMVSSFFIINYLRGKDIFNREIELKGYFKDVEGLVASAPAAIKGYAAGHVSDIKYRPETDDFEVVCSVKKEFLIPEDSQMTIYSTSIMGTKGIKIDCGESSTYVKNGSVLTTGSEADLVSSLGTMLTPLINKVNGALDTLTAVLGGVNDVLCEQNKKNIQAAIAHLNATLASARDLAGSLGGKSEEINSLVDNLKALSDKFAPLADSAQVTLENIEGITSQLNEAELKELVGELKDAAGTVDKTVKNIEIPLNSLLSDVDSLVNAIKENPKKYIKITVF